MGCGSGGGDGDTPDAGIPDAAVPPALAPFRARRLLARQYINTVEDLLGPAAAIAANPADDLPSNGFISIGAAEISLSPAAIVDYEESARAIGLTVVFDPTSVAGWIACTPSGADDTPCLTQFVTRFGRAAFRRPLETVEIDQFVAVGAAAATEYDDWYRGVQYAIMGLLQSPNFLYQVEVGEPDPDDPYRIRLSGYEMATRLSFFLTDSTPPEWLLQEGENGNLHTDAGIRAAALDLIDEPRAKDAVTAFYEERFRLSKLDTLPKDPVMFPEFSPALGRSMRQEAISLINDVIWDGSGDFRELLTANYAFVDADLAALYGVTPPQLSETVRRDLPANQMRSGILTQAGFLASNAHPAITSPTRRGLFVADELLCAEIPPPPPDVNPQLPPDPGMPETLRQKLIRHMEDPSCANCHRVTDNIGLTFESFDAIGRWRADDRGLPLDLTGNIDELGSWANAQELGTLLADSPTMHNCVVRRLYRHATAHNEVIGELTILDGLTDAFVNSGYSIQELLVEMVVSEGFRKATPEEGN